MLEHSWTSPLSAIWFPSTQSGSRKTRFLWGAARNRFLDAIRWPPLPEATSCQIGGASGGHFGLF